MLARCGHCGYTWNYIGKHTITNCPKCRYKVNLIKHTVKNDNCKNENFKPVKTLEVTLTPRNGRAIILPIGDIHVGAPEDSCEIDKLKGYLDFALNRREVYIIGMGDYGDWAQKMPWKRGPNVYEESKPPMEQYWTLYSLFKPLAEKGKIIGLHAGNHDMWIYDASGIDIVQLLCSALKVPYLGQVCSVFAHVGGQKYKIYSKHGTTGAKKAGTKLQRLIDDTARIPADIYLMGHVHDKIAKEGAWIDENSGKRRKCYYCLTGCWLRWEGTYAQLWGDPSPSGTVRIELYSETKEFVAHPWDIHVSL